MSARNASLRALPGFARVFEVLQKEIYVRLRQYPPDHIAPILFSVTKSSTTSNSSISMCCLLPCASTHFSPRCLHPCFIDLQLLLLPSPRPPTAIPIGEEETAFPLLSSCATSAASVSALSTRTAIEIDDPWVESVILNRGSTNTIGKVEVRKSCKSYV